MTTPIEDAAGEIKTALEATGVRVYYPAPTIPVPPCYVISPAKSWYQPASIGSGNWEASFIVESFSDSKQIQNGHAKAAEMQWDAMTALSGLAGDRSADAPRIVDLDAQGQAIAAALSITLNIKE